MLWKHTQALVQRVMRSRYSVIPIRRQEEQGEPLLTRLFCYGRTLDVSRHFICSQSGDKKES